MFDVCRYVSRYVCICARMHCILDVFQRSAVEIHGREATSGGPKYIPLDGMISQSPKSP